MNKKVIRNISEKKRLQAQNKGKKRNSMPIGFDRIKSMRSNKLDLFKPRSALKTKNLINYLLGNSSRAQRAALSKKYTRLRVKAPNGLSAVRLRFD